MRDLFSEENILSLGTGILFGAGLTIGGMTEPSKILQFLDVTGNWNPSLLFVMGGALLVHLPVRQLIERRMRKQGKRPWATAQWDLPTLQILDRKLIGGSALFGIGWGLSGFCPGPAWVSLVSLQTPVLVFVAAMFAGFGLSRLLK